MTDPPPPGNIPGLIGWFGQRLINALPPGFLLLIIFNCLFLGAMVWVFDHNAQTRNALLNKIIEHCLVDGKSTGL
jgi:hypothetical protein